jgi:hypothetical protein
VSQGNNKESTEKVVLVAIQKGYLPKGTETKYRIEPATTVQKLIETCTEKTNVRESELKKIKAILGSDEKVKEAKLHLSDEDYANLPWYLAENNRTEAEPGSTPTCDPIKMLREAQARIAAEEDGMTKAEKWAKHLERLDAHNKLIAEYESKKRYDASGHLCAAPFCGNPGSISHSTSGGGNYYCQEHYRRAG